MSKTTSKFSPEVRERDPLLQVGRRGNRIASSS